MTVKDLIKRLQSYPGDMEVLYASHHHILSPQDTPVTGIDKVSMLEVCERPEHLTSVIATDDDFDDDVEVTNCVILF